MRLKRVVEDFSNFAKLFNFNSTLIKQLHSQKQIYKDWKRLALCRRWSGCWWPLLLETLKKYLYVIRSLSSGKNFTIQKYEARCHTANSVTSYLNEMSLIISESKTGLLIQVTSVYLIMQFGAWSKRYSTRT